jgi:hypothetical protein
VPENVMYLCLCLQNNNCGSAYAKKAGVISKLHELFLHWDGPAFIGVILILLDPP